MRILRTLGALTGGLVIAGVLASCGGGSTGEAAGTTAPTTPPAPTVAAAKYIALQVDTVRGPDGLTDEQKGYLSCIQQNRYPQGSQIVWRVRVTDPATGKDMDDKAVGAVTLTLPDGTTQKLKYGGHPKDKPLDSFWTTSFKVPATYATGAFNYKLDATSLDGRTGTFTQFNVGLSLLQIVPAGKQ